MHRREALRNVALLVGGGVVLSGTTMSMLFDGCSSPNKKTGALFTADQEKMLSEIADIIIPTTSCPGAKAAGVGPFISMMIHDCYPENVQKAFVQGLSDFQSDSKKQLNKSFLDASAKERETSIASLREKTIAQQKADRQAAGNTPAATVVKDKNPKSGNFFVKTAFHPVNPNEKTYFFALIRDLTILGYFSSEIGATQARTYIAVPGHYDGNVPLKPGQKAWA